MECCGIPWNPAELRGILEHSSPARLLSTARLPSPAQAAQPSPAELQGYPARPRLPSRSQAAQAAECPGMPQNTASAIKRREPQPKAFSSFKFPEVKVTPRNPRSRSSPTAKMRRSARLQGRAPSPPPPTGPGPGTTRGTRPATTRTSSGTRQTAPQGLIPPSPTRPLTVPPRPSLPAPPGGSSFQFCIFKHFTNISCFNRAVHRSIPARNGTCTYRYTPRNQTDGAPRAYTSSICPSYAANETYTTTDPSQS